jgi:hypothetical protein
MSDVQGDEPESTQKQLSRSLGTIWANHTGGRPGAVSTQISGDVVKCELQDAEGRSPDTTAYKHDAIAAVSRVMGRRVRGFIPKHDSKTDVTTDTFILEPPRVAR